MKIKTENETADRLLRRTGYYGSESATLVNEALRSLVSYCRRVKADESVDRRGRDLLDRMAKRLEKEVNSRLLPRKDPPQGRPSASGRAHKRVS